MHAGYSCAEINTVTAGNENRVGMIADAAPDCACEQHSMSQYSPGLVKNEETIARMVCIPMHVHKKKPELLPSFFGHVFSFGMSAQRLEKTNDAELANWVNQFVGGADDRVWLGYVQAPCKKIRDVLRVDKNSQAFCVYDVGLVDNGSHVEICASNRIIEDADRIETRARLRQAFSNGKILSRASLKDGRVQSLVNGELLMRDVADCWKPLIAG